MVKCNTAKIYCLTKNNYLNKIRSKRILNKRKKFINKFNIIKKKFINKVKNRYNHLENNLDNDLITGEPIYLIHEKNLHIININDKLYGINALNYLKWFNFTNKFKLPKNIITNQKITINEYETLLNKCEEYYDFLSNNEKILKGYNNNYLYNLNLIT